MTLLRLYLWKEWREQRVAVLALAGLLPVLVLGLAFVLPGRVVGSSTFAASATGLALGVMLIAIGGELLGERRTTTTWLERLPEGLGRSFQAKLLLFFAAVAVSVAYGHALGALAAALRGVEKAAALRDPLDVVLPAVVPALAVMLWTFAASAWCHRGMVALLAGTLLAATLALPFWVHPDFGYQPEGWEVEAAIWTMLGGALVSAWFGYHGGSLGRRPASAALRGIGAGALCLVPLWSWTGIRVATRDHFDLAAPGSRVTDAFVFGDGRSAVLNAWLSDSPWSWERRRALHVDLDRGTFEWSMDEWSPEPSWDDPFAPATASPDRLYLQDPYVDWQWIVLDGNSGDELERRVLPGAPPVQTFESAGLGRMGHDEDWNRVYFDPFVRREFPADDVLDGSFDAFIGPEGWLVCQSDWSSDDDYRITWYEFSPTTGALVQADWLDPVSWPGACLADGRILAIVDEEIALVDPRKRGFLPIHSEVEPWFPEAASGLAGFRPGEPVLFDVDETRCLLDVERLELRRADPSYDGTFLRWLPDGTLFFLTDVGIERRDPDGTRHVAFALADARVD